MVYLFSSTFRKQYLQDILNILALPNDAIYHFRYNIGLIGQQFIYIDPKTTEASFENSRLDSFYNQQALLVLVDQSQSSTKSNDIEGFKFYPLRQASIIKLEPDGTTLHAYFKIGEYI